MWFNIFTPVLLHLFFAMTAIVFTQSPDKAITVISSRLFCGDTGEKPKGKVIYTGPIINRGSGKGIDIIERSCSDGARIQQWKYADQPNQIWEIVEIASGEFAIVSNYSGKVLEIADESVTDGAIVQLFKWRGGNNQRWRLNTGANRWTGITNINSGKCLDVSNYSRDNGASIHQWDCHGKSNQQWKMGK